MHDPWFCSNFEVNNTPIYMALCSQLVGHLILDPDLVYWKIYTGSLSKNLWRTFVATLITTTEELWEQIKLLTSISCVCIQLVPYYQAQCLRSVNYYTKIYFNIEMPYPWIFWNVELCIYTFCSVKISILRVLL